MFVLQQIQEKTFGLEIQISRLINNK